MQTSTPAKIIASLVVLVVGGILLNATGMLGPIGDALRFALGEEENVSVEIDNPLGDLDLAAVTEALDGLAVGDPQNVDYDREGQFGRAWLDVDDNGCDTRNDILARDLVEITYRPGTRDCVVASGVLHDPYSGQTIRFVRGNDTSNAVQIDHVVALSDAWQKGAQQWDEATRVRFGNDPLNLLAVDGPLNQQKGDGDAATWLPPNRAYRCPYVARQVAVKDAYGLWVTQAEQDAMVRVLSSCPDEPLPTAQSPTATSVPASPAAPAVPTTPPPASPAAPVDTPFRNCSEARAAGAAPVHRGDPGYGPHLDRDGDGIGCE